jgi:hypothetical protein
MGIRPEEGWTVPLVEKYTTYNKIKTPFKNNVRDEGWFLNLKSGITFQYKSLRSWNAAEKT